MILIGVLQPFYASTYVGAISELPIDRQLSSQQGTDTHLSLTQL